MIKILDVEDFVKQYTATKPGRVFVSLSTLDFIVTYIDGKLTTKGNPCVQCNGLPETIDVKGKVSIHALGQYNKYRCGFINVFAYHVEVDGKSKETTILKNDFFESGPEFICHLPNLRHLLLNPVVGYLQFSDPDKGKLGTILMTGSKIHTVDEDALPGFKGMEPAPLMCNGFYPDIDIDTLLIGDIVYNGKVLTELRRGGMGIKAKVSKCKVCGGDVVALNGVPTCFNPDHRDHIPTPSWNYDLRMFADRATLLPPSLLRRTIQDSCNSSVAILDMSDKQYIMNMLEDIRYGAEAMRDSLGLDYPSRDAGDIMTGNVQTLPQTLKGREFKLDFIAEVQEELVRLLIEAYGGTVSPNGELITLSNLEPLLEQMFAKNN